MGQHNLNNLELHFTAAPFAGVTFDDIYNPSNTGLGVAFLDPYEVVFAKTGRGVAADALAAYDAWL